MSDIKIYYKATVTAQAYANRSKEQNRDRNRLTVYG